MNIDKLKKIFIKEYKEPDYDFLRALSENEYEHYLKEIYRARTGLKLNLKNPKRLNEKIQYLKLHGSMEEKCIYTDKVLVRDYYMQKIGSGAHLKELLGVYNSFDEIDFDSLPDKFMMQVNHGSKMHFKVKNKALMPPEKGKLYLKKLFTGWLNYNFAYCAGFEMQYKNIEPKIIIEKLYENKDKSKIIDMMFFCFDGRPQYIESLVNASEKNEFNKIAFYDLDWNALECGSIYIYPPSPIEKPLQFDKMLEISKKLAEGFKFVRVDFMLIDDDFYFLELTFTPNSGFVRFKPDKYDFYFGKFLNL